MSSDTTYTIQINDFTDTITAEIKNGGYQFRMIALGYKDTEGELSLKEEDEIILISLIPLELNHIDINWEGAIITIIDSTGRFRTIRHKP